MYHDPAASIIAVQLRFIENYLLLFKNNLYIQFKSQHCLWRKIITDFMSEIFLSRYQLFIHHFAYHLLEWFFHQKAFWTLFFWYLVNSQNFLMENAKYQMTQIGLSGGKIVLIHSRVTWKLWKVGKNEWNSSDLKSTV